MRSRALVLLAVLAAALALVHVTGGLTALRDAVSGAGAWGPALLLAAWLLGTPLLVPGTALCALAGLALGPVGVLISLLGSPLGALLAFGLARRLGHEETLRRRAPRRALALVERVERSGPWGIALIRMAPALPVGPFNYACGLTRVRARHFALGSALGAAPRVVLYGALGGSLGALPFL